MTVKNDGSLARARADLKRLERMPNERVAHKLDAVLHAAFLDTQARTHEVSGTLRASGRSGSNLREGDSWLGRIAYGGPGTEQALYEMALGGPHDFFAGQPEFDDLYEAAIVRAIEDEL